MFLFLLASLCLDHPWEITRTDIFGPLSSSMICVSPSGHLYIAVRRDGHILHFNQNGVPQAEIGRRGSGPGEFSLISSLQFIDGKLYAFDLPQFKIQVFDEMGGYSHTLKPPLEAFSRISLPAKKVKTGWVLLGSGGQSLILVDDDFNHQTTLCGETPTSMSITVPEQKYNPAADRILFDTDQQGGQVFFYEPGSGFRIQVYDVETRKVVREIKREYRPVPLDLEWAQRRLDQRIQQTRSSQMSFKPDFPKFFPVLHALSFEPGGYLRLYTGTRLFNKDEAAIFLDRDGRQVKPLASEQQSRRILAVSPPWVYVSFYKELDDGGYEACVKKLKLTDLEDYFQASPFTDLAY